MDRGNPVRDATLGTAPPSTAGSSTSSGSVQGSSSSSSGYVDVPNVIVSSVEATGDFPKPFRLSSPPVTLKVVVKDEKGNVVEKPKLAFRATDDCIEATPDGVVHPLAVGECSVVVESAGKTAKIDLDVKD